MKLGKIGLRVPGPGDHSFKFSNFRNLKGSSIKNTSTYLLLLILFISCKKENSLDCFKSTGADIRDTRYPGQFTSIEMNDKIEVTILKGNEYKVEVIAGEHIIKNISTKVTGDVLQIDNNNKCNFVRGYKRNVKVYVTLPHITKVTNAGVASLNFAEDFAQDTLIVRATNSGDVHIHGTYNQIRTSSHGNGDIYMSGTSNSLYVYTNGTNYVFAENLLVTDFTFVETLTLGDCTINASKLNRFAYNIHGNSGNIYYTGNPPIIEDVGDGTGTGKAIEKN